MYPGNINKRLREPTHTLAEGGIVLCSAPSDRHPRGDSSLFVVYVLRCICKTYFMLDLKCPQCVSVWFSDRAAVFVCFLPNVQLFALFILTLKNTV